MQDRSIHWRWVGMLMVMAAADAEATNGINLIGFGAESVSLGGADVAYTRDATAVAINPAGLSGVSVPSVEGSLEPYYLLDVGHSDSLGNERSNEPRAGGFVGLAYAQPLIDGHDESTDADSAVGRLVVGAGLFVAGGLGFHYEDLDTGFGTRDEIATNYSVIRFAPGIAWTPQAGVSLGASLSVNYALARFKEFPDSSVLAPLDIANSLFGNRVDGLSAVGVGYNLGVQYQASDSLMVGLAYRSRAKLDLDGGKLTVNFEALGAGRIAYRDVELDGISVPQDLQAGVVYAPGGPWKLTAELDWIDWSQALDTLTLKASDPDRAPPLGGTTVTRQTPLELRDQYVTSLGVIYAPADGREFRLGYNYARRPIPDRNLSPVLAMLPERHFTAGYGQEWGRRWGMDLGVVYIPHSSVRYSNPSKRVSADAEESNEILSLQFSLSYRWD